MPGEAQEPAHPSRPVTLVSQKDFEELRAGVDMEPFESLRKACTRYAKRFRAGITSDDLEDVVSNAILDVVPLLASDDTTLEVLDRALKKSIERHRQRFKRQRSRFSEPTLPDISTDPSDQIEARDRLRKLIAVLAPLLATSLERLASKDRGILIQVYGLAEHGYEKSPDWLLPTSREAKKKALQRARIRFSEQLEQTILEQLELVGERKEILVHALRIAQGKKLDDLFETIDDLTRQASTEPTE